MKIRQNQIKKVYKVTLGFFSLKDKDYYEASDGKSINVLALNVDDALYKVANWRLEEEKKAKKEKEGVFISEVTMKTEVDLI